MQKKNRIIFCYVIMIFAITVITCSYDNSVEPFYIKTYFNNGAKSVSHINNNKIQHSFTIDENRVEIILNNEYDTLKTSLYESDSLIFCMEYDSISNKINDYRRIFYLPDDKTHMVNDTVIVRYFIKGPMQQDMLLSGSSMQIEPDTNINFHRKIFYDSIEKINKLIFVPEIKGEYRIRLSCLDKELLKIVGYVETYIDVK